MKISRQYLDQHYWKGEESIHVIAEALGTYPNKVRRAILAEYGKMRTKSEAQKLALKNGVSVHPTEGRHRREDEKTNISKSVAENWDSISEAERNRRSKAAKKRWEKIPKTKRQLMSTRAAAGVRRAAKEGSSLEKFLLDKLKELGYNTLFHQEAIEGTDKMHVDLLIPSSKTAIEVDGPSHFLPIWGEESLANHQKWDKEKNAILLKNGFNVIRIKLYVNTISQHNKRQVLEQLNEHLKALTDKTSKLVEIEVKHG